MNFARGARRALLVTGSAPGGRGVGELFIRSMCSMLDQPISLVVLGFGDEILSVEAQEISDTSLLLTRRSEAAFKPMRGRAGRFVAWCFAQTVLRYRAATMKRSIATFARQAQVSSVWVVLDCPMSMLVAAPLANALKLPLQVLVWDMPEYLLPRLGHNGASAAMILRGFDDAICRSHRVAVMSDAMRACLEQRYGASCTLLHQPVDPRWIPTMPRPRAEGNELVIGFAGSVTSKQEMALLLHTLDRIGWRMEGAQVKLRVYGLKFTCQATTPQWIEFRGYLTTQEVVAGFAECDILFLPQPFADKLQSFARFSFPTKLTTYLSSETPILLLAPPDSSLARYFRANDLPMVCDQLDPDALELSLRTFARDHELRVKAARRARELCESDFSEAICRQRLGWLLQLPDGTAPGAVLSRAMPDTGSLSQ